MTVVIDEEKNDREVNPASIGMIKTKGGWKFPAEINPVDLQRNEMVTMLAEKAEELNDRLVEYKKHCEETLYAHVAIALDTEVNNPHLLSGEYQSLDGRIIMEAEYAPVYRGTEHLVRLKELLNEAIVELKDLLGKSGISIIKSVLKMDTGNVDVKQLGRLSRISGDFLSSESWREAVSLIPLCSELVEYHPRFRFYHVGDDGSRSLIMQNFSSIKINRGEVK